MSINLRRARPEDAAPCGRICYEAFREIALKHNFPVDFPGPEAAVDLMSFILARNDVYSVVAESGGRIVGSNFLWENPPVGGIGPITIDPAAQNAGVGRAMMEELLRRAGDRDLAGVRLVQAAYHGRSLSLYTKLGFAAREPLSTMQGPAPGVRIPGYDVRAAREDDLEACNALCTGVHGHQRGAELLDAIRQGSATVVEHGGRVTGYATTVGFFGHTVAETNRDLKALIGSAREYTGPGFLLPTRNTEVFRWCLDNGLRVVQPMTLMSRGLYNEPAGAFMPSILY